MKKTLAGLLITAAVFCLMTGSAFSLIRGGNLPPFMNGRDLGSSSLEYETYANVTAATQVSMEIWFWDTRTLPKPSAAYTASGSTVIPADSNPYQMDFSAGLTGSNKCLPGRTSWASDNDNFSAVDGNIGFTVHCLGPLNSNFKISSGKMRDAAGHEIPYSLSYQPVAGGPVQSSNCFGFSCRVDDESGRYIFGGPEAMRPHSLGGSTYTLSAGEGYGHDFSVYNLLYVPATTPPGDYSTTGVGDYAHLMVSWY